MFEGQLEAAEANGVKLRAIWSIFREWTSCNDPELYLFNCELYLFQKNYIISVHSTLSTVTAHNRIQLFSFRLQLHRKVSYLCHNIPKQQLYLNFEGFFRRETKRWRDSHTLSSRTVEPLPHPWPLIFKEIFLPPSSLWSKLDLSELNKSEFKKYQIHWSDTYHTCNKWTMWVSLVNLHKIQLRCTDMSQWVI